MTVSVVIPAYNAGRFLGQAIESVVAQSLAAHEIIVVDDGSSDDTFATARACPGVTCLRQANRGAAAARNAGIGHACGDFIAFLDADDVWLPDKLERQLAAFDRHPEAGFSFSAFWFVPAGVTDARDAPYEPEPLLAWLGDRPDSHGTPSGVMYKVLLACNCVNTSSVLVRAPALREVGGFDDSFLFGEDWDLWLRLAERFPGIYMRRPTARVRLHGESLSGRADDRTEAYYSANVRVLEKHLARTSSLAARRALGRARAGLASTRLAADRRREALALAVSSCAAWPTSLALRTLAEAAAPRPYRALAALRQRGSRVGS